MVIELKQEVEGWAEDPRGSRERAVPLPAVTDGQGRFLIAGLAPGFYTLTAKAGEARPLVRRGVQVAAGGESVLADPLVFQRPLQLPVRLTPVADPWQRPWQVRLVAESLRSGPISILAEGATDATGLALLQDLDEGEARLEVRDADGRTWLEQLVDVYPERPEAFASVDVVAVEGRLYFGDEALSGNLSFGTTQGILEIRMQSGDDGRFQGYLPNEGTWPVEVLWPGGNESDAQRLRDVQVRRRPGKSYAEVEIRIPPTEVRGRVLSHGRPAANVGITVGRDRGREERKKGEPASAREAILLSDAEGRFRLRGVEPGNLWLLANRGKETSGKVRLQLTGEAWPTEVVLELEEKTPVRGMVTFGTQPVAGAQVLALPQGQDFSQGGSYVDVTTDASGLFELWVPAGTTRIDFLVAAPSLGVELLELRKTESGWPPALVALESESGTLRFQLEKQPEAADFASGLVLRKNGATLRLIAMVRALSALKQVELEPGQVVLPGLAPGTWQICLEAGMASCRTGDLPAHGELKLESPRERGAGR